LGKLGKLRIQLQVYPGGQKGKSLQQPFHIRICAGKFVQGQPRGNLGELPGKLTCTPSEVLKFLIVVF
jgi:hypothetical protein